MCLSGAELSPEPKPPILLVAQQKVQTLLQGADIKFQCDLYPYTSTTASPKSCCQYVSQSADQRLYCTSRVTPVMQGLGIKKESVIFSKAQLPISVSRAYQSTRSTATQASARCHTSKFLSCLPFSFLSHLSEHAASTCPVTRKTYLVINPSVLLFALVFSSIFSVPFQHIIHSGGYYGELKTQCSSLLP